MRKRRSWRWTVVAVAGLAVAAVVSVRLHVGRVGGAGPAEPLPAPVEAAEVTVFLVGDAGGDAGGVRPVLSALARDIAGAPGRPVVVFLGDNVYPHGLPRPGEAGRADAERRLELLLEVLRATGAHGVFLPGNHDWDHDAPDGWDGVRRQAAYVRVRGVGLAEFLPHGGCPGPEVLDLGSALRLVVLDTQWWLREGPKPRHPASPCPADTPAEVVEALRRAVRAPQELPVVVVAHHPLASGGPHGGHLGWQPHLFPLREIDGRLWVPLPILGSVYAVARKAGVTAQDLASETNRRMRGELGSALTEARPLVYASGHEHNLQVLAGTEARYYLVSGAGTYGHVSTVHTTSRTRFARSASGYMRLDVLPDGRVRLGVVVVDALGRGAEPYARWLR